MSQPPKLLARLQSPHIPALDGLRAVAVFLVILYHFGIAAVPGAHGVMVFFVLSGFLITWLLLKENEREGSVSLSGFYRRRVLRIFPAFYAYWALLVGMLLVTGKDVPWPHAWSSFFYTSNYYVALGGDPSNGFSHTWSLAIEEQFYLLWPCLFLVWRADLKKMALFLVALIEAVWLYRALLCFAFGVDQAYIYAAFDTRLDNLMVGCLLAVVVKVGALKRLWRATSAHAALPLVTLALLILSIYAGPAYVPRYRDVFGFALEPLLIALLITQLIALSDTPLWRWVEWPAVRFLGRISYSLYLYQQVTLFPVRKALGAYPLAVQLAAAILFTVAVATVSYYVIERPFLRLKERGAHAGRLPLGQLAGVQRPG
jgi:peptidoglycan/LPS O-acetylase OafA/YrhL